MPRQQQRAWRFCANPILDFRRRRRARAIDVDRLEQVGQIVGGRTMKCEHAWSGFGAASTWRSWLPRHQHDRRPPPAKVASTRHGARLPYHESSVVVVLRWDPGVLASVAAVLDQARSGQPSVLVVEGEPGTGKSSLLDEVVSASTDFQVLRSEGLESGVATAYGVLARLGADMSPFQDKATLTQVLAAQRLRGLLDEVSQQGPVLAVLDDLQWADPESLDAVVDVMSRLAGDRLLIVVGTRPLRLPGALARWQQWVSRPGRVVRIELTGLSAAYAATLIRELRPEIDSATAHILWRHTDGNPLYLQALLAEYEPGELAREGELPAPGSFAESVAARLSRLPSDAVRLADAMAVLGSGWFSVFDVAALAQVTDSAQGLQDLVDAGLVQARRIGPTENVRTTHALIRAAMYQNLSIPVRRSLHARATTLVTSRGAVLEHRMAAAAGYDQVLAADLETYAEQLHLWRSYRPAAHYWQAASALTPDPHERERRWLESNFDLVLSGDRRAVHADLVAIRAASDGVRAAMVTGALAIWDRRQTDAVEVLAAAAAGLDASSPDGRSTYRVAVLLAWGLLQAGRPAAHIAAALDQAAAAGAPDPAVQNLATLAAGTLLARSTTAAEALGAAGDLPERAEAVPFSMTPGLIWRATLFSGAGRFAEAAADLAEITDRVHKGQVDINGGAMHAFLGRAQWFLGRWPLARVNLRIAVELSQDYPHPMTVVNVPLATIGGGDFATAESDLRAARELLDRAPWVEAVDTLTVNEVIYAHAQGLAPADLYDRCRPSVRAVRDGAETKNMLWLVHVGLAALWADEIGDAAACAEIVESAPASLAWAGALAAWLSGLVAEARGNGKLALSKLRTAIAADNNLPLYQAHVLLDHARLAHLLGDLPAAGRSLELAAQRYRGLGAAPYLQRAEDLHLADRGRSSEPVITFSGRERDVLALTVEGLSYAQIARDLFITQSTVSYHLGNIYAKANVGSRHQLTDIVRADPAAFGLT